MVVLCHKCVAVELYINADPWKDRVEKRGKYFSQGNQGFLTLS